MEKNGNQKNEGELERKKILIFKDGNGEMEIERKIL